MYVCGGRRGCLEKRKEPQIAYPSTRRNISIASKAGGKEEVKSGQEVGSLMHFQVSDSEAKTNEVALSKSKPVYLVHDTKETKP